MKYIGEEKWEKIYWFSRMLLSGDKYGAIGKESSLLISLTSSLRELMLSISSYNEDEIFQEMFALLQRSLLERFKKAKSRLVRIKLFISDLEKEIQDIPDFQVFIFACEFIVLPINKAISNIPSNDEEFAAVLARKYLDEKGMDGLATVISLWDSLGIRGSLNAERNEVRNAFGALRNKISTIDKISEAEANIILTAFVQEFERRAAQKRKTRAGTSLESVTSFILNYFGLKSSDGPAHFQADIEIDNWIKCNDGWLIAISCKRTLRERWKQVSSADANVLSKFKIKYVFNILTFDEDLSDDKISTLGGQRHIFYLPDNSRVLKRAGKHIGLKNYVRPISSLITDIKYYIEN